MEARPIEIVFSEVICEYDQDSSGRGITERTKETFQRILVPATLAESIEKGIIKPHPWTSELLASGDFTVLCYEVESDRAAMGFCGYKNPNDYLEKFVFCTIPNPIVQTLESRPDARAEALGRIKHYLQERWKDEN